MCRLRPGWGWLLAAPGVAGAVELAEHSAPEVLVERLLAAPDVPNAVELAALKARHLANAATEEDKWQLYRWTYCQAWGIDVPTEAFVEEHTGRLRTGKVTQLMRVLFPRRRAELDASTAEREILLRAPLIRQTLDALGLRSAFDTDLRIPDLMAVFNSRLRHTEMFSKYGETKRLFMRGGVTEVTAWDLIKVSKAVNSVLGECGLKLHNPPATRSHKKRANTYGLDPELVATMKELVLLRLRRRWVEPESAHAAEALRSCVLTKYAANVLLPLPPPPPPQPADLAPEAEAV